MNNSEIREELLHSLHEWGVSGSHLQHRDFRKKVISSALEWSSSSGSDDTCNFDKMKSQTFPDDIHDAYHHVLVKDIKNLYPDQCVKTTDTLDVEGYGEPKHRFFDRTYIPPKVTRYLLKRQYRHLKDSELDPLRRYKFETLPKEEFFFDRWFASLNVDAEEGILFEAWFACHAIKNEACFNCEGRNCLRWAGGCGRAWQDLVCTSCGWYAFYFILLRLTIQNSALST